MTGKKKDPKKVIKKKHITPGGIEPGAVLASRAPTLPLRHVNDYICLS